MTDPSSAPNSSSRSSTGNGAWIGLDFGTTHSCAAVWDSARGRPKVLRLESALPDNTSGSGGGRRKKRGRLVPTVVVLVDSATQNRVASLARGSNSRSEEAPMTFHTTNALRSVHLVAVIGAPALRLLDQQSEAAEKGKSELSPELVSSAMVTDLKLRFSTSCDDGSSSSSSAPFLSVVPIGRSAPVSIDAKVLVEVFLAAMRGEAESYLLRNRRQKGLVVPCASADDADAVDHVVVGVPCHWNHRQRHCLERFAVQPCAPRQFSSSSKSLPTQNAATTEGRLFQSAKALTEPTAAALSYGLGVGGTAKVVLVLDVGGGTTDVSISELSNDQRQQQQQQQQRVLVTAGAQVGGNDVDQALLEWFQSTRKSEAEKNSDLSPYEHRTLLRICRQAKEDLCNEWSPDAFVPLSFQNHSLRMDTATFEAVTGPVLGRIEDVVAQALEKFRTINDAAGSHSVDLDEVVMVGGSTKIPLVAEMLRRVTRRNELCQVHPLTAVAQGAAIHAAQLSHCVPVHELQSALLLDALPYAIGVMVSSTTTTSSGVNDQDSGDFVPVLAQYASVPARGSVRFALADKFQTGVTVPVVERVDGENGRVPPKFEAIQSFQFLLRKLSPEHLQTLSARYVEIRILFTELGQLFVTVVDELDPEHQRKYNVMPKDDAAQSLAPSDAPPMGLIVTALALAILYVAVKLAFHEVELKG